MRVGKTVFTILLLCKLMWKIMLFTVVAWNFFWLLYTAKSMLGLDLIEGWSLIH